MKIIKKKFVIQRTIINRDKSSMKMLQTRIFIIDFQEKFQRPTGVRQAPRALTGGSQVL